MRKLFFLFTLLIGFNSGGFLPLVQVNSNPPLSNELVCLEKIIVIDNVNQELGIQIRDDKTSAFEICENNNLILNIPWKNVKTIEFGKATNLFISVLRDTIWIFQDLHLQKSTNNTNNISFFGEIKSNNEEYTQQTKIQLTFNFFPIENNPNITMYSYKLEGIALTLELDIKCLIYCFIDKVEFIISREILD